MRLASFAAAAASVLMSFIPSTADAADQDFTLVNATGYTEVSRITIHYKRKTGETWAEYE